MSIIARRTHGFPAAVTFDPARVAMRRIIRLLAALVTDFHRYMDAVHKVHGRDP